MSKLPSMWATTKPINPIPVNAITYLTPNEERHCLINTFINALSVDWPRPRRPCDAVT
jgi:hypothetical protein